MTEENKEEVTLTSAKLDPWGKFLLDSIELDKQHKGWHWFWGLYFLHRKVTKFQKINLEKIQSKLPDEHWLKNITESMISTKEGYANKIEEIHANILQTGLLSPLEDYLQTLGDTSKINNIQLSRLNFRELIDFSNFIFPIAVSFEHTTFSSKALFKDSMFYESTVFINAVFFDKADFGGFKSFDHIQFDGVNFTEEADFLNAKFKVASFKNVNFSSYADFSKVDFYSLASFLETKFVYGANFFNANFMGIVYFSAEFCDTVNFHKAKFMFNAYFTEAIFKKNATFDKVIFEGAANFTSAVFSSSAYSSVSFSRASLENSDFTNTQFINYAPSFYDAKIGAGIILETNAKLWPHVKNRMNNETDDNYKKRITDNQNAYENLSAHMKGLHKYHNEHFFYRQEMRCRQKFEKNSFTYCSYWLYEKFADYGYGIEPAFRAWRWHIFIGVGIIFIGAFVNAWLKCWKYGFWGTVESMFCSIPVSVANSHSFLFFNNGPFKGCYEYFEDNLFFNTIWAFQTILGVGLLFLVLLTLRTRFRLK